MDELRNYDWVGLLEKVVVALVILLVTWIVAKAVKTLIEKLVVRIPALQRTGRDGQSIGSAIGQIASLLIWMFGLIAILQVFRLEQVLSPIQGMLDTILSYLPNVIGAGVVFFIGLVLARIVRQLVGTALHSAGLDERVARLSGGAVGSARRTGAPAAAQAGAPAGAQVAPGAPHAQGAPGQPYAPHQPQDGPHPGQQPGQQPASLTNVLANLAFAVVLVVVAISALQILGISAISDPATSMLQTFLDAIPNVLAAAVLLVLGWVIAKFVGQLLESTLAGLSIDRVAVEQGIVPEGRRASSIIATAVKVAIVVFFAIMATRMLGFPEITAFLEEIIAVGGRILFGAAFVAVGVLVATLLRRAIGRGTPGQIVYWATVALFAAMGLSYMGIAESIVNLAFGAVVVGGALAAALAFGLGGRDAAARTLGKAERRLDADPTVPGGAPSMPGGPTQG
ncbi:mechanosensitive ion channel [Georgenia sp. Z1491]|uniref:mechanosensitive ion channel n=1 Tax=Georgenia sp. Z1491 TaxID=3416707 RepID=UPI003CE7CADB